MKKLRFLLILFIGLGVALSSQPTQARVKIPANFRLVIPTIGVNLPVGEAHFYSNTWYIPQVTNRVEHLQGRPLPGQNNNVPIAAHIDLGRTRPGPFFNLKVLKVGDPIQVVYGGTIYEYSVQQTSVVAPTDLSSLYTTSSETLTLITCAGTLLRTGYTQRLIVRAVLVDSKPVPTPVKSPAKSHS